MTTGVRIPVLKLELRTCYCENDMVSLLDVLGNKETSRIIWPGLAQVRYILPSWLWTLSLHIVLPLLVSHLRVLVSLLFRSYLNYHIRR